MTLPENMQIDDYRIFPVTFIVDTRIDALRYLFDTGRIRSADHEGRAARRE